MNAKYKSIADFALSKVGCGYVYGATGWVCSEARRQQQARQYPEWADNILGVCSRWDGKQCYDCAQLTRAAAKAAGIALPSGATSQWNADAWEKKGEIATLPAEQEGLMLYRQSSGRMQHTGVSVGNGYAVDARGSRDGVVKQPLTAFPWTHWGRLRLQTGGMEVGSAGNTEKVLYQATVVAQNGKTVNLRQGASATTTILVKVPLGSTVDVLEDLGEWRRIRYNVIVGYMMAKYILAHTSTPVVTPEDVSEVDRGAIEYRLLCVEEQLEELHDAVKKLSADFETLQAR